MSLFSRRHTVIGLAVAGLCSISSIARADVQATWLGASGNWDDGTQWNINPNYPDANASPGTLFDVYLNAGSAMLDTNPEIQSFDWEGGNVTGTGTLTVDGSTTWSAGNLYGNINANGGLTISGGGNVYINGGALNNGSLSNATIGTTGSVEMYLGNGGVFNNNGTFTASNGGMAYLGGAAGTFNNSGAFYVDEPASTFAIGNGVHFNNTGSVEVQAGTLALQGSDSGTTTGSFAIDPGAALDLQSGFYYFLASASTSGSGTMYVSAASLNAAAPAIAINSNLYLNGGSISSTAAGNSFAVGGNFSFSSGTIYGEVDANGGLTISGGGNVYINGGALNNGSLSNATIGTTGSVEMYLGNGGVFNNNGTFTASNGAFVYFGGAAGIANNAGKFIVDWPGNTFSVVPGVFFNNSGTVCVSAGTLALQYGDGGSTTGAYNIGASGAVDLQAGVYTFESSATTSGSGTMYVSGSAYLYADAHAVALNSNVWLDGGSLSSTGPGNSFAVGGNFSFSSGDVVGEVDANGGLDIAGGGSAFINGGTLTNGPSSNGSIGTGGNVYLELGNGGVFNNNGTFTASNGAFVYFGGAAGIANNAGKFIVDWPGNTFSVVPGVFFNNSGTVCVSAGTLALQYGDGGSTTGAYNIGASGAVDLQAGVYTFESSATTSGSGTMYVSGSAYLYADAHAVALNSNVWLDGGSLSSTGPGNSFAVGGNFSFSSGDVVGEVDANGGLDIAGGGSAFINGGTLTNGPSSNGSIGTGGNVYLELGNGGVFNNNGTFTASNGAFVYFGGAYGTVANSGTFIVNWPGNTFDVVPGVYFDNSGTVCVQAGTLGLQGGDAPTTGAFNIASGAAVDLQAGTYTFESSATSSGNGTLYDSDAYLTSDAPGVALNSNVALTGGYMCSTAPGNSFAIGGNFTFSSGYIEGEVDANGGLNIAGNNYAYINAGTLTNGPSSNGSIGTGGDVYLDFVNGAVFNNQGCFTASNGLFDYGGGAYGIVNNSGKFKVNWPSHTFYVVPGVYFNNSGTVCAQAGTLALQGGDGGDTTGAFDICSGAAVDLQAGNYTFSTPASSSGKGTLFISGGDAYASSPAVPLNSNVWLDGGYMSSGGSTSNSFAIGGCFTFSSGFIQGNVLAYGGTDFAGNGYQNLSYGNLTIEPHTRATIGTGGAPDIEFYNGSVLTNLGKFIASNGGMIYAGGAYSTFSNCGYFEVNNPGSTFPITNGISFTNSGTVVVKANSYLSLPPDFTNTGRLELWGGTLATTGNTLNVGEGTITGSGTVDGNLILQNDPSTIDFVLGGTNQGQDYDSIFVDGNVTLGGNLIVKLTTAFESEVSPSDVFTLLEAPQGDLFTGGFLNVANGGFITTADGHFTFQVFFTQNNEVRPFDGVGGPELYVTDFAPTPEPTSIALLAVAGIGLLTRRRRVAN